MMVAMMMDRLLDVVACSVPGHCWQVDGSEQTWEAGSSWMDPKLAMM
jgi:hypothetical protein